MVEADGPHHQLRTGPPRMPSAIATFERTGLRCSDSTMRRSTAAPTPAPSRSSRRSTSAAGRQSAFSTTACCGSGTRRTRRASQNPSPRPGTRHHHAATSQNPSRRPGTRHHHAAAFENPSRRPETRHHHAAASKTRHDDRERGTTTPPRPKTRQHDREPDAKGRRRHVAWDVSIARANPAKSRLAGGSARVRGTRTRTW